MSNEKCQECGSIIADQTAKFCQNCGSIVKLERGDPESFQTPSATIARRSMFRQFMEIWKGRPVGLTIISVIYMAGGFGLMIPAFYFILFSWRLASLALAALGAGFIVIGILVIYEAYGIWQGYHWARTVLLVLTVLGIIYWILSLFESYLIIYSVPLLIEVLVIYYVRSESVRLLQRLSYARG